MNLLTSSMVSRWKVFFKQGNGEKIGQDTTKELGGKSDGYWVSKDFDKLYLDKIIRSLLIYEMKLEHGKEY